MNVITNRGTVCKLSGLASEYTGEKGKGTGLLLKSAFGSPLEVDINQCSVVTVARVHVTDVTGPHYPYFAGCVTTLNTAD